MSKSGSSTSDLFCFPFPLHPFFSDLQENPSTPADESQKTSSELPTRTSSRIGSGRYSTRGAETEEVEGKGKGKEKEVEDQSMSMDLDEAQVSNLNNQPSTSTPIAASSTPVANESGVRSSRRASTTMNVSFASPPHQAGAADESVQGLVVGDGEGEGKVLRGRKRKEIWSPSEEKESFIQPSPSSSATGLGRRSQSNQGSSTQQVASTSDTSTSRTYSKRERTSISRSYPAPMKAPAAPPPSVSKGKGKGKGKSKKQEPEGPVTLDAKGKEPRSAGLIVAPPGYKMVALPQTETQIKGHKAKKWVMIREDEELPDVRPEDIDLSGVSVVNSGWKGKGKAKEATALVPLKGIKLKTSSATLKPVSPSPAASSPGPSGSKSVYGRKKRFDDSIVDSSFASTSHSSPYGKAPAGASTSSFIDSPYITQAARKKRMKSSHYFYENDPSNIPGLTITHPHHLPIPPLFDGSVEKLWDSFTYSKDDEIDIEKMKKMEREELELRLRIDKVRNENGTLPMEGFDSSTNNARSVNGLISSLQPVEPPRPGPKSFHTNFLTSVINASNSIRLQSKHQNSQCKKIARMISNYWERKLGTGLREKKAEEKRIRNLAKWTSKEVSKQWKLAVNVVKAGKQKSLKEMNEKRGLEQLNAILAQSTQMLEAQRGGFEKNDQDQEEEEDEEDDDQEDEEDSEESEQEELDEESGFENLDDEDQEEEEDDVDNPNASALMQVDDEEDSEESEQEEMDDESNLLDQSSVQDASKQVNSFDQEPEERVAGTPDSEESEMEKSEEEDEDEDEVLMVVGGAGQIQSESSFTQGNATASSSLPQPKLNGHAHTNGTASRSTSETSNLKDPISTSTSNPDLNSTSVESAGTPLKTKKKDQEFVEEAEEQIDEEDEDLERKMWEEDESEEGEDEGLADDANMPIEELLKKYGGYGNGQNQEEEEEESEESEMEEDEEEMNSLSLSRTTNGKPPPQIVELNPDGSEKTSSKNQSSSNGLQETDGDQDVEMRDQDEDEEDQDQDDVEMSSVGKSRRSVTRGASEDSIQREKDGPQKLRPPFLLRGTLRPYQQIGYEWLASLYANGVNGILADEMVSEFPRCFIVESIELLKAGLLILVSWLFLHSRPSLTSRVSERPFRRSRFSLI